MALVRKDHSRLNGFSSILYRNDARTIFLLDIPGSIELAQAFDPAEGSLALISCYPRQQPFPSNEPKTANGYDRLACQQSAEFRSLHEVRARYIFDALREIKSHMLSQSWCLGRETERCPRFEEPSLYMKRRQLQISHSTHPIPPVILSLSRNFFHSINSIQDILVLNPFPTSSAVDVAPNQTFRVPPQSAFALGELPASNLAILTAAPMLLHQTHLHKAGHFDMILLDPPWANRSVRRSQSYTTGFSLAELKPLFNGHVSKSGFVGIWVTNNEAVEKESVDVMRNCGFMVYEVWLWIKTTTNGEPVSELSGMWRRPYECLLVFKKLSENFIGGNSTSVNYSATIQHRIIAAVPDLHSRKPCLKELIETVLFPTGGCRVLEVFARHLTAGWWSWGDEVLKFNWTGHWTQRNPVKQIDLD